MNTSGEAADQVMRMVLNGTEVLIKLTGSGAKNTAAFLVSVLKQSKKTKGAARLASMLKSERPLKIYAFDAKDLPKFKEVAAQYGILYCVLKEKDKTGGVFDVMVRADDESKMARITERFHLCRVNSTDLRAEIIREKEKTAQQATEEKPEPEKTHPQKGEAERLADEILSAPMQKETNEIQNPTAARTEIMKAPKEDFAVSPSEQLSDRSEERVNPIEESEPSYRQNKKPSIRKKIDDLKKAREKLIKDEAKIPEIITPVKNDIKER